MIMELPDKIKLLPDGTCNTYLIDDEVKVLVDAGADYDGKIDIILLTHAHKNHISHLKELMSKNPDCDVYVNISEVQSLVNNGIKVDDRFKGLYEGKTIIDTGTYKFQVIEVPAHSRGSVVFVDEVKGVLFSGDSLLSDGPGSTNHPDSNPSIIDTVLSLISHLKYKIALPGHGEPFLKPDEPSDIIDEVLSD